MGERERESIYPALTVSVVVVAVVVVVVVDDDIVMDLVGFCKRVTKVRRWIPVKERSE